MLLVSNSLVVSVLRSQQKGSGSNLGPSYMEFACSLASSKSPETCFTGSVLSQKLSLGDCVSVWSSRMVLVGQAQD